MANCTRCGVELTDTNWRISWIKRNIKRCTSCGKGYDARKNPNTNPKRKVKANAFGADAFGDADIDIFQKLKIELVKDRVISQRQINQFWDIMVPLLNG